MTSRPDGNGLGAQGSAAAVGLLSFGLSLTLLGQERTRAHGLFLALLGPALILAAFNHRRVQRGHEPSRALWGSALVLLTGAVAALGAGHAALVDMRSPTRVAVGVALNLVLPTILHLLWRLRLGLWAATWHNVGWLQFRLQAGCVVAFSVLVVLSRALDRDRGAQLEILAAAIGAGGLALLPVLKRRGFSVGPIDHNTLFHLSLAIALTVYHAALEARC